MPALLNIYYITSILILQDIRIQPFDKECPCFQGLFRSGGLLFRDTGPKRKNTKDPVDDIDSDVKKAIRKRGENFFGWLYR